MDDAGGSIRMATREHAIVNTLLAIMACVSALFVDMHHHQRVNVDVVPCQAPGRIPTKSVGG